MAEKNFLTMSENGKSEYCCSVVKISELTPIEGSDFLAKTNVLGTQIVVRKDMVKEGDIMFYAANETALNQKFLSANNLYEISCRSMNANAAEVNEIMLEYDTKYRNEADTLRAEAKQIKGLIDKYEKQVQKDKKKVSKLNKQLGEAEDDTKKSEIQMQINDLQEKIVAATKLALEKTVKYTDLKHKVEVLVNEGKPIVDKAKALCGFFNKYGRVRCITLKNTPSFGFLFEVDSMAKFNPGIKDVNLEDYLNQDFDTVDGELFVKAYVPPVKPENVRKTRGEKRNKKLSRFDRLVEGELRLHYDTTPLAKNMMLMDPDKLVAISVKVHGCVEKSTIVNTKEFGDLTIGEIVDNKINCHILARDIEKDEDVYVPIDQHYMIPNDGDWYEIELEDGRKLTITGNNPVWLPELNCYRKVEELVGDEYLLSIYKVVKIKSIKKLDHTLDRYDLTVSSTNNFYANGVLIHNTSSIIGKVHVKNPLPMVWHKKAWNKLIDLVNLPEKIKFKYDYTVDFGPVYCSRTVVKNQYINQEVTGGYYNVDIWSEYGDILYPYLDNGMTVYSEIAGYLTGCQTMIQKQYAYGCQPGENFIMPYRISTMNEGGVRYEWNVQDVCDWTVRLIDRMKEAGDENWKRIHPIDILYHGTLANLYPEIDEDNHWHENVLEKMKNDKEHFGMEDYEPLCTGCKVPREGIVIRIDDDPINEAFKLKTTSFALGEALLYDDDSYQDIEVQQGDYESVEEA